MYRSPSSEPLQNEIEKTEQVFSALVEWFKSNKFDCRGYTNIILFQVAAALEAYELEDFKKIYILLRQTKVAQAIPVLPYGSIDSHNKGYDALYFQVEACLLAALEIVKKNRNNLTVSSPAVLPLQEEVGDAIDFTLDE